LSNTDSIKKLGSDLKNEVDNLVLVLGADLGGKASLAVFISDNLVKEKDLHAGNTVREAAKAIKGGGGGQPAMAIAGGKDASGLDKAIELAKGILLG